MKCPTCESEQTRLTWLREFHVVYWCGKCHAGFDVNRHRSRIPSISRPLVPVEAPAEAVRSN